MQNAYQPIFSQAIENMALIPIVMIILLLILSTCSCAAISSSESTIQTEQNVDGPKYGSQAKRLFQSHNYISTHKALDYWAISPYYIAQQNERSCSVASITMIVNAARVAKTLTSNEELATQQSILNRVNSQEWNRQVSSNGIGVTLNQMKQLVEASLKAFNIQYISVEIIHTMDLSEETKQKFHKILIENENSSTNFLIANFDGSIIFDDVQYGHFAPIAAYDADHSQILVMDPERQNYEPYWISEDMLLHAMVTQDPESAQYRGYIWIKIFE
ncbi:unnamed protein product [Didymodactylos carnosus]|uniref:glutathione gamma-glutamylcysteinyltransferase n=1 Tax=Didymodactylos carnosus TaxID=1234261 RepID=A0A814E0T6_9BILA|nr:unnamed protein product [Didymodactylos carnosus]CAF1043415.1 unnamed protein product [Didymodactylos carnosus]CAF3737440.1 unnamed protein product [Didymodactylos carnosus]CAF3811488.1 unnamed protein product [Didymodactylos carnosus]